MDSLSGMNIQAIENILFTLLSVYYYKKGSNLFPLKH